MEGTICPKCGAANPESSSFCNKCGTPVPTISNVQDVCPKCGADNSSGAAFCSKCGAALTDVQAAPVAQPTPPQQLQYPQQAQYGQPQQYRQAPQQYGAYPPQHGGPYGVAPIKPKKKAWKIILIIAIALIVIAGGVWAAIALTGGGETDPGYYQIGAERVPSVAAALGKDLKIQGTTMNESGNVATYSFDYNVSGSKQGDDMRKYFAYLQSKDGFTMRGTMSDSTFDQKNGSGIQAWRNAGESGQMLIVQADFDEKGYTITVMSGEGQASGNAPTASAPPESQTPVTETPAIGTPSTQAPASTPSAQTSEFSHLLPTGAPTNSTTFYGYTIATYSDGTVSVNEGRAIIKPDGSVYMNGELYQSNGMMEISDGGDRIEVGHAVVAVVDNQMYIAANGGMIYVDSDGTGYAYTLPE